MWLFLATQRPGLIVRAGLHAPPRRTTSPVSLSGREGPGTDDGGLWARDLECQTLVRTEGDQTLLEVFRVLRGDGAGDRLSVVELRAETECADEEVRVSHRRGL